MVVVRWSWTALADRCITIIIIIFPSRDVNRTRRKRGKTFSRIPPGHHRLLLLVAFDAPCQNGIRFIVRPSLKIVKRQHKHTTKKSKKNIQNGRCLWIRNDVSNKMNNQGKRTTKWLSPTHDSRRPRLWEFVDFSADAPKRNKTLPFFFLITFWIYSRWNLV